MRPLGALLFGYIGDHIGRKTTVIITMMIMATSCIIMATLPTYSQIGITAAWLVTLCRIAQGISSMGEIIGAELYLTETTELPVRYPIVGLIGCAAKFGVMVALGITLLIISCNLDWRNVFWVGAVIAVVGSISRIRLRETPDFVDMKRRIKRNIEETGSVSPAKVKALLQRIKLKEKVSWKTVSAFFMIYMSPLACLYFSYIYCGNLLKGIGYTWEDVIYQNFFISIAEVLVITLTVFLSYKIHPLKILKVKALLFLPFVIVLPFFLYAHTQFFLCLAQFISVCFALSRVPATAALVVHFPIFKRFTYVSLAYAASCALMAIIASFGFIFLTEYFGYWGLWIIMIPITIGFLWGVSYFQKLESHKNYL